MKIKTILIITAVILILSTLFLIFNSEPEIIKITWEKNFGGKLNDDGWYVLTLDEGCITAGYSEKGENIKNRDIFLVRLNNNGEELWNRTYGGKGSDVAKAIIKNDSNSFIILGSTTSYGKKNSNIWIIMIDNLGNEIWNKTYGGDGWDEGNGIISKNSDEFIIVGNTNSYGYGEDDIWLINIDNEGKELWNKTYGGPKEDIGRSIDIYEQGYVIGGISSSYGNGGDDMWLLLVNETGFCIANHTFGTDKNERCNQVITTSDNNFLLIGHSIDKNQNWNAICIKTTPYGITKWEKTLDRNKETGFSSCEEISKGYIISGHIGSYGQGQNALLMIFNENGKLITEKIIKKDLDNAGVWINKKNDSTCYITGYKKIENEDYDLWIAEIKIN